MPWLDKILCRADDGLTQAQEPLVSDAQQHVGDMLDKQRLTCSTLRQEQIQVPARGSQAILMFLNSTAAHVLASVSSPVSKVRPSAS